MRNGTPYALAGAVAAILITTTSALAGSGVGGVFNLGQLNTVDAQTSLTGNPGGNPQLKVVTQGTGPAVRGEASIGIGINGVSVSGTGQQGLSQSGIGLYGLHSAATGTAPGVQGQTASADPAATGVFGRVVPANSAVDSAAVRGVNNGNGMGVYGRNLKNVPTSYGVVGDGRYGLVGTALFSGASSGVYGTSPNGFAGVEGHSGNANGYGVYGNNTSSGSGVYGAGATGPGVFGNSTSWNGIQGFSSADASGVYGQNLSGGGYGIAGRTDGGLAAALGDNIGDGPGVVGRSDHGDFGVHGEAGGCVVNEPCFFPTGVFGNDPVENTVGVYGDAAHHGCGVVGTTAFTGDGTSVWVCSPGSNADGAGVYGDGTPGVLGRTSEDFGHPWPPGADLNGVEGIADVGDGNGVQGLTRSNIASGVYGQNSGNGYGVAGRVTGASNSGTAVLGDNTSTSGWAGYFNGDVHVTGTLSAPTKLFQIDDPLDPAHKYLVHTTVESPDMLDVYNGNVVTDGRGFAVVHLPRYFQALNRSFRYQLTIVGTRGWNARVVREIAHNSFTIQTDTPRVKVSWQVTGIRHDRWANAHRSPVEQAKPPQEQGTFLYPKLYGKPSARVAFKARVPVAIDRGGPRLSRVRHLGRPRR